MPPPTRQERKAGRRAYMAEYRSRPFNAAVNNWYVRTLHAAQRELARKHPDELLAILDRIREDDPKPEAEDD